MKKTVIGIGFYGCIALFFWKESHLFTVWITPWIDNGHRDLFNTIAYMLAAILGVLVFRELDKE
jgi:hypothetical protein